MTEARDVEEIVEAWEDAWASYDLITYCHVDIEDIRALIADWRAKKAKIDRLKVSRDLAEKELEALSASHKDLAHRLAEIGKVLPSYAPSL